MSQDRVEGRAEEGESADSPLFRREALEKQNLQAPGHVLLVASPGYTVFTLFALICMLAVIGFLLFGHYTRKERIEGQLIPERGLLQIRSPRSGTVTEVQVSPGDVVKTGDALLRVSADVSSTASGATQASVIRQLENRLDSLDQQQETERKLTAQRLDELQDHVLAIEAEQRLRDSEIEVQRERVRLAEEVSDRFDQHRDSGAVSDQQWREARDRALEQRLRLVELERQSANAERERETLLAEAADMPLEQRVQESAGMRERATLEQALIEAQAQREVVLSAPQPGVVAAVHVVPGGSAAEQAVLVDILPEDSPLEARLKVPTRAIGFVEVGQSVLIRYLAFPYQKFGQHRGQVVDISRITGSDLGMGAESFSALGTPFDTTASYLVRVALDSQQVTAYGREIALQPGMELEADLLVERRRLIEWVFEPLQSLKGHING
ncbi:MAG: hypothetical protein CSB44_08830 [Gammaproteobacteria bacterium]|nr:MAG: hypothetical protein CSB44_08830 [Gammaproteobacteria bacterium]